MGLFDRQSPLMYFVARRCLRFLKKFENQEYRIDRNGETWLLQAMAGIKTSVFVDVGCNKGEWAAVARRTNPEAKIYAFEIMPGIADQAKARFSDDPMVEIFDVGLGDRSEDIEIHYSPEKPTVTSLYRSTEHKTEAHPARIEQASGFLEQLDVTSVDVLKIDVEGAEHLVLKGVEPLLEKGAVRLIQFEYGLNSIETRVMLKDYYDLLDRFDYKLGKLYPHGVGFKPYDPHDENFWGPNYVAIRKGDEALSKVIALSGFRSLYLKHKRAS